LIFSHSEAEVPVPVPVPVPFAYDHVPVARRPRADASRRESVRRSCAPSIILWCVRLASVLVVCSLSAASACGPSGPEHVVLGAADIQSGGTRFIAGSHDVVHGACIEALRNLSLNPVSVSVDEIVSGKRPYVLDRPRFSHGYTLRLRDVPGGVQVEATPWLFDGGVDISARPVWDRHDQRSDWNGLFAQIEQMAVIFRKVEAKKGALPLEPPAR